MAGLRIRLSGEFDILKKLLQNGGSKVKVTHATNAYLVFELDNGVYNISKERGSERISVYFNNKRIYLDGNQLLNLLQQLQETVSKKIATS